MNNSKNINNDELKRLSEAESAALLYIAVVVADGKVMPSEPKALHSQIEIIGRMAAETPRNILSSLGPILSKFEHNNPVRFDRSNIVQLAQNLTDPDLQILILSSVFEIAYSDDEFHQEEKKLVRILKECWDI